MNNDPKQRFFLMMAIGLTIMLIMQYLLPTPEPPPMVEQSFGPAVPQTAPAAAAADVPESAKNFRPEGDYTVRIRVGEEGAGAHGYEAAFSSVGGGLTSYRLLGYFRQPQDVSPENRIILLDRYAQGRDSLRVDAIRYGPDRQNLADAAMGQARYELVEIPAGAQVDPAPPAGVRRGENLVFRTVAGDWELVRTYRFPKAGSGVDFTIAFDMEWRNIGNGSRLLNYTLVGPAGLVPDDDSPQFGIINFITARQPSASATGVEIERVALQDLVSSRPMASRDNRAGLAFVGAKNRFFTALMTVSSEALTESNGSTRWLYAADPKFLPAAPDILDNFEYQPNVTTTAGETPVVSEANLAVEPGTVPQGGTYKASYTLYAGPAVDEFLVHADPRLEGVVSYTWHYFDFISRWLVKFLTFLDEFLGNYGLAIIVMTIIIKLILHPLNRKSFVSMNKMSKLAPMMKDLQKKYTNDKVKLQQEMGKLYKSNGVSMAGGCLPVFLQLPIFLALYGAFSQGFSMRHAPFLSPWIKDLSKPDSVYDLNFTIPLLNSNHISILPILYFVLQYIQMSLQPKPNDPQQAQQQKIMKFMPLFFVFIFYAMPAGLVLYFTVSALCGVLESTWMRKVVLPKLGLGDTPAAMETAAKTAQAGAGAAVVPSKKKKRK
ncbi:MAG: YidC/Oxa1 family insertase periplasmic-domain containing protein [Planctomycetota bacterium]|nr:YidC/Oxa1 family insertase periplasmic-domain containing protein [Planctomycetota bacterium]